MKKTKVIIVDDSLLVREILQHELERDINIQVVAKVADAFEARTKIIEHTPDILLVDIVMEKMSGVEFVRQLLPQYYLPVIMMSAYAEKRADAEKTGAVAFIDKPQEGKLRQSDSFFRDMLLRIKSVVNDENPEDFFRGGKYSANLVAIGASTGGAEAIESLLTRLPSVMPPIMIAQHMPPRFTKSFAQRLNTICKLSVKEAADGDVLVPGQVYIAPGGYHTSLKHRDGIFTVCCEENVSGSAVCPNIDVLFSSVAAGGGTVGVLLTGMGRDGAAGLKLIRDAGGRTIGQDEHTSVIYGMPKAAFELGAVCAQLPLNKIPGKIIEFAGK